MSNFDLHEFNILSKRHNYFLTNNRINGFPLLKNNSIFLQKILAHRVSNSSERNIKFLNDEDESDNFTNNKIRIYQSPIITQNRINTYQSFNMESIKPINSRKINENINAISPERINNDQILMNRIVTPTYIKVPITVANRVSKSPNIYGTINIKNKLGDEVTVLNIGGKKIFATNSFNGLTNCTQSPNTPIKNENSELFRNYNELKKKKEEIFKRKMKRNSSIYRNELLKKQKDKEIKEQRVNINFLGDNDKLRIIPLKKKIMLNSKSQNSLFSNSNNNINDNINNSNINDSKQGNTEKKNQHIIILQKSKNLYSKKKFKTNNIFISKNIKNNINNKSNNNSQINQRIKDNLEYFRIKKEKSKPTFNSPEKVKHKKFVEDYNPNISQIIYSNDRKISIKMNVLNDKNMTFSKRKENVILEIQKVICINYKCGKKNCLSNNNNNITKNKKIKRQKNLDILCSIKEEEEKSKPENQIKKIDILLENEKKEEKNEEKKEINDDTKKDKERPVSTFVSGVRSRYINRFHKH